MEGVVEGEVVVGVDVRGGAADPAASITSEDKAAGLVSGRREGTKKR